MKLFITVQQGSDPRSGGFNLFDYKVMFFLKEGFKLLHSNHNMRESYGELYASFIKEIDDDKDIEVERRLLKEELNQYLERQRFNTYLIDVLTGESYETHNMYEEQFREQEKKLEVRILEFMVSNIKYKTIIPPHKLENRVSLTKIYNSDDVWIDRVVDDDKIESFMKLKVEVIELVDYRSKNLLPPPSY